MILGAAILATVALTLTLRARAGPRDPGPDLSRRHVAGRPMSDPAGRRARVPRQDRMTVEDRILDTLAVARITRLVTEDRVPFGPLRDRILEKADEDSAGLGSDSRLAELVTCPWCMSMWVGAAVVLVTPARPRMADPPTRPRPLARRRRRGGAVLVRDVADG